MIDSVDINKSTTLVSVVMPAFNAGQTLGAALQSVLRQSHQDLEVLIGDDASTDDTCDVALSLHDPRLHLYRGDRRLGPGPTRDRLISAAKGRWIAFLDADDAWAPQRLRTLLDAVEGHPDAIAFDDILRCHEIDTALVPWRRLRGVGAFKATRESKPIAPVDLIRSRTMLMQPFFSTALLRDARATHGNSPYGEDTLFLLHLIALGGQLIYVPQALYFYRVGQPSASADINRHSLLLAVLKEGLALFPRESPTHEALECKIRKVERQEARLKFGRHLKQGRLLAVLGIAWSYPSLFLEVFRHNAVMLGLRVHRLALRLGLTRAGGQAPKDGAPGKIFRK